MHQSAPHSVSPWAQRQKVQCDQEQRGGGWPFLNTGSHQPQDETVQIAFSDHKSQLVTQDH